MTVAVGISRLCRIKWERIERISNTVVVVVGVGIVALAVAVSVNGLTRIEWERIERVRNAVVVVVIIIAVCCAVAVGVGFSNSASADSRLSLRWISWTTVIAICRAITVGVRISDSATALTRLSLRWIVRTTIACVDQAVAVRIWLTRIWHTVLIAVSDLPSRGFAKIRNAIPVAVIGSLGIRHNHFRKSDDRICG